MLGGGWVGGWVAKTHMIMLLILILRKIKEIALAKLVLHKRNVKYYMAIQTYVYI